jgi:hypothetical protein
MMRYALAKPRVLKTSLTLAAVMATSLLMASSALAWTTLATAPASTTSSLNAMSCAGHNSWSGATPVTSCYGWGSLTSTAGWTAGVGALFNYGSGSPTLGTYVFGTVNAAVRGVDCSPSACVQAGENNGLGTVTGASLTTGIAPTGATASRLNAVSCNVAGACLAVGRYTDSAGKRHGYAVSRATSSGSWAVAYVMASTETTESSLTGVSCVAARCYVVGTRTGGIVVSSVPIALTYDWSTSTTNTAALPATSAPTELNGISCVETPALQIKCLAVGGAKTTTTGPMNPLYLQASFAASSTSIVNYTTQTGTAAPPAGATVTRLNGAACFYQVEYGIGCRVVGDSNATGTVQPYLGTLTTAAVQPSATSATATGTSCYDAGPSVRCWDVATATVSANQQAIYNTGLFTT